MLLLIAAGLLAAPARARQTVRPDSVVEATRTPTGALWRAAVLPGWGQVYNRQYVKLPFVYGAIGGLVFLAVQVNGKYHNYQRAYLFKAYQERVDSGLEDENRFLSYKPYYDDIAAKYGNVSSTPLRNQRDSYRRNRDLSFLGAGLVYALTVLDAYVSAHLADFDVGEDLSLQIFPTPSGPGIRASWTLR